jgi:hypothetical protein
LPRLLLMLTQVNAITSLWPLNVYLMGVCSRKTIGMLTAARLLG